MAAGVRGGPKNAFHESLPAGRKDAKVFYQGRRYRRNLQSKRSLRSPGLPIYTGYTYTAGTSQIATAMRSNAESRKPETLLKRPVISIKKV